MVLLRLIKVDRGHFQIYCSHNGHHEGGADIYGTKTDLKKAATRIAKICAIDYPRDKIEVLDET